ncbi:unnamed protein product, partial [Rotaria sp. Silwood2]
MPEEHEFSIDLRKLAIERYSDGKSIRTISKDLKLSHSTVHYIIKKWNRTGSVINRNGRGRKRLTTSHINRIIHRRMISSRRKSAREMAAELKSEYGVTINAQTIRNRKHEAGYRGCVARRKPLIKKSSRWRRVIWARKHQMKNKEFWHSILWSDESKFNLFGSDGRQIVWRQPQESMKRECLKPTVKYGGGSVMVWGCMAANGVGNLVLIDGTMYKEQYEKIFVENVKQSAKKLKIRSFIFQQDNDPKHTARTVSKWFANNKINVLEWLSQLPDLNLIEHLWDELERRMKPYSPRNKEELWTILKHEWEGIGRDVTSKLVDSMSNRLNE